MQVSGAPHIANTALFLRESSSERTLVIHGEPELKYAQLNELISWLSFGTEKPILMHKVMLWMLLYTMMDIQVKLLNAILDAFLGFEHAGDSRVIGAMYGFKFQRENNQDGFDHVSALISCVDPSVLTAHSR